MNFITNLSFNAKERTAFNSILIIINRFIKFIKYIIMNKIITAKELTFVFKKHIINDFNTPNNIISN